MNEALEQELETLLSSGQHEQAVQRAITGYGPEFRGYLVRILRSEDEAEEAYSLTWEHIWKGLPRFQRTCAFRTWAYRIVSHAAAAFRRKRKDKLPINSSLEAQLAAPVPSSLPRHLRSTEKDRLAQARLTLSEDDQELLVLRVDRQMPWDDIAIVLSTADAPVTAGSLRTRFARLKAQLQALIGSP